MPIFIARGAPVHYASTLQQLQGSVAALSHDGGACLVIRSCREWIRPARPSPRAPHIGLKFLLLSQLGLFCNFSDREIALLS